MSVSGQPDALECSCQVTRTGSPREVRCPIRSDARIASRSGLPANSSFYSLGKCVRKERRTPHRISRQSGFRVGTSNTSSEPSYAWRPEPITYRRRQRSTTDKGDLGARLPYRRIQLRGSAGSTAFRAQPAADADHILVTREVHRAPGGLGQAGNEARAYPVEELSETVRALCGVTASLIVKFPGWRSRARSAI
jgi:hypothetical protein